MSDPNEKNTINLSDTKHGLKIVYDEINNYYKGTSTHYELPDWELSF
ncbi:MAG: hypothetical protein ACLU5J_05410 [Christensenellales bacterium]